MRTQSFYFDSFGRAALLSLALFGASCAGVQTPAGPEPDVAVRIDRWVPESRSLREATVAVKVLLANPKSKAVQVESIDYEFDTGELLGVVRGQSAGEGATLEAGQQGEFEFSQDFTFPEAPDALRAAIEKGVFPMTLRGAVRFADGSQVAFERPGEVVAPLLPKFLVHDAQAAQYGKSGLDVTFFLRLMNENIFPMTIDAVEYTLFVEGQEIKTEQGGIGTRLVGGAVQEFEVNTAITEKSPPALRAVFKNKRLQYQVKGKVSVVGLELPFELGGEIALAESES